MTDTMQDDAQSKPLTKKEKRLLKKQEKLEQVKQQEKTKWLSTIIRWGVGIAILVGILIYVKNLASSPTSTLPIPELTSVSPIDHVMGATESAKLVIEYSDFQCPACAAYQPLIKQLLAEHGSEVTFVYRHFPLKQVHKQAELAAYAAEAAYNQGKFWEMHDILFSRQKDWENADNPKAIFTDYAKELELNIEQFTKDIDSEAVKNRVEIDYASGLRANINSTPTFFYNGKKMNSIRSYEEFRKALDFID